MAKAALAHAYCLTGDAEAAWDVTQESWLGIMRGIARLEDPAAVSRTGRFGS